MQRRGSDAGSVGGTSSGSDMDDDDDYSYYGKPTTRVNQQAFDDDDSGHISAPTIMPPRASDRTMTPQRPNLTVMPGASSTGSTLQDVREFIDKLDHENSGNEMSDGEGGDHPNDGFPPERSLQTWDRDALEEIASLGEGASGAVYKVRDRRSGKIMARKAIPATNSTPPRQLLRELSFLSTCLHENITSFYGAFISSPESDNSAEVSLLMEYCEGNLRYFVVRSMHLTFVIQVDLWIVCPAKSRGFMSKSERRSSVSSRLGFCKALITCMGKRLSIVVCRAPPRRYSHVDDRY